MISTILSIVFKYTVGIFFEKYLDRHFRYRRPKKNQYLYVIQEVMSILNDISANTPAQRVLILKCHNGGSKPKLGSELYSTVVLESYIEGNSELRTWERQRLDDVYLKNLINVDNDINGMIYVPAKSFKGSILENVYAKNNTGFSKIATLYSNEDSWFYLSINYPNTITEKDLTPKQIDFVRGKISRLRSIFRKNKNIL